MFNVFNIKYTHELNFFCLFHLLLKQLPFCCDVPFYVRVRMLDKRWDTNMRFVSISRQVATHSLRTSYNAVYY